MRAATVVQVLQELFLSFIACFILLVIAPYLAHTLPRLVFKASKESLVNETPARSRR